MASHRRILSSKQHTTLDCYEDCSSIPFLCSPPSPSPIPTVGSSHIHTKHLPNLLIASLSILASSFFLLLTYYAVLSQYRRRRRVTRRSSDPSHRGSRFDDLLHEGERDHHVWHIRTVGLDVPTINSIAVCVYKVGDGLVEGTECTVCLGEFRDGELVRLLPKCSHAFHVACIDTWLNSHLNCPLCRAHIVTPTPESESSSFSTSPVPGLGSSVPAESFRIGIESDRMVPDEERENGGVGSRIGIVMDPMGESSCLQASSGLWVESGSGECGLHPVRRSVSMDSPLMNALLLTVETEGSSGEERKESTFGESLVSKNRGKQGNASEVASPYKGPLEMERSLSSRSGRFFLSRNGRARNSIIPL